MEFLRRGTAMAVPLFLLPKVGVARRFERIAKGQSRAVLPQRGHAHAQNLRYSRRGNINEIAVVAHAVPAMEMNWCFPWGSSLSKNF